MQRVWFGFLRLMGWATATEQVSIPGPAHPAPGMPGMLELWQVTRTDNGDVVPRCLGLIVGYNRADAARKAHDLAAQHGVAEYYLTTPAGEEVDSWVLTAVKQHAGPEISVEEAAAMLRHSEA